MVQLAAHPFADVWCNTAFLPPQPKLSAEDQDLLLSDVLLSAQSRRYPPSKRYQKTFLRNVIQTVCEASSCICIVV